MVRLRGTRLGSAPLVAAVISGRVTDLTLLRVIKDGASLFEFRVDTFRNRRPQRLKKDAQRLKEPGLPVILTIRSHVEGGRFEVDDAERLALFELLAPYADCIDIELGSGAIIKKIAALTKRLRKKLIVSFHDFAGTPARARLLDKIKRARAQGADMVKIATRARTGKDIKTLASILSTEDDLIVIAMGKVGAPTRVAFPILGSLITYGAMGSGSVKTAPGQMTVRELDSIFSALGY